MSRNCLLRRRRVIAATANTVAGTQIHSGSLASTRGPQSVKKRRVLIGDTTIGRQDAVRDAEHDGREAQAYRQGEDNDSAEKRAASGAPDHELDVAWLCGSG